MLVAEIAASCVNTCAVTAPAATPRRRDKAPADRRGPAHSIVELLGAYLSWPGGVKLYGPSHAQGVPAGSVQVTVMVAWNPLNRPVPPENVSGPVTTSERLERDVAVGIVVARAVDVEVAAQHGATAGLV